MKRRVQKNLAPTPRILAAARERAVQDVAVVNARALEDEARRGLLPWRAEAIGIVGEDRQHLLLEGVRSADAIVEGAKFYDPVGDEGVIVARVRRDQVLIEVGPLHLSALTPAQSECLRFTRTAYDEDHDLVSRLVIEHVLDAAATGMRSWLDSPSWRTVVPANSSYVWRALGERLIMQFWGAGVDARRAVWV